MNYSFDPFFSGTVSVEIICDFVYLYVETGALNFESELVIYMKTHNQCARGIWRQWWYICFR
jgi:hypothetical protein